MTDTTQTKRKLPADIQVVDLTSGVPTPLPKRQSQQFHPGVSRSNLAVPQTQQSPQGNRNNSADEDDDALAQEVRMHFHI